MDSIQYGDNEDLQDIEDIIKKELEIENDTFLNKAIDQKLMIDVDNGSANIEILESMLFTDLQLSPIIVDNQSEKEFLGLDIVTMEQSGSTIT